MKTHCNTLYVTTQGSYLSARGETVVVRQDGRALLSVPLHMIEAIVAFGRVSCSPFLMACCGERGIGIAFLSRSGRFLARVQGRVAGNILLRKEQYRRADAPERAADVARSVVAGKLANCRQVLRRFHRDHPEAPGHSDLACAADRIAQCLARLKRADGIERIRGIEGEAARTYFSVFDSLVLSGEPAFRFARRSRRPPLDPVNALLSFAYTLLLHDVASALEAVGLDPQAGFLHRDRPGRLGLALDMMEELRPYVADRLVLSLINRQQVTTKGFETRESGAVSMAPATRKLFLLAYQRRKADQVHHGFLGERTTVGMVAHLQARLLARHLRGDLDAYPPFTAR